MEEDNSLQASTAVFDWDGDDEERFAMEKVHGVNDFDKDDQAKFSAMDEVTGFGGDDDWRAMASEAAAQADQTMDDNSQPCSDNKTASQTSEEDDGKFDEQMQAGVSAAGLQIMRFTRKRTPNPRARRSPGSLPSPLKPTTTTISISPPRTASFQQTNVSPSPVKEEDLPKPKVITVNVPVKAQIEAPGVLGQQSSAAIANLKKVEASEQKLPPEAKVVSAKAGSYDLQQKPAQVKGENQALMRRVEEKKMMARPKQALRTPEEQLQQYKKPKALAFQKSRNIINKRINADSSVRPEAAALELDCSEVAAMQGKHRAAAAEFRALGEEIRPLIAGEGAAIAKEIPAALQEKWMELHCKKLRVKFDLHFAIAQHFLCHSPHQCL